MSQSAQVSGGVVSHAPGLAQDGPADAQALASLLPGSPVQSIGATTVGQTGHGGDLGNAAMAVVDHDVVYAVATGAGAAKKHTHDKTHGAKHVDTKSVDEAIGAVERGDEDAATAAGFGGGGGGSLSLGLRVDRVAETVTPQEFTFNTPDRDAVAPSGTATNAITATSNSNATPVVDEQPNRAPEATRALAVTKEDTPVSGKVQASDPDGDTLTYAKGSNPAHGTVEVAADGTWTYTPNKDYNNDPDHLDSFTVVVSDDRGHSTIAVVDIGVMPVNDPPKVLDTESGNFDPVTGHYVVTTDEDKPVSGQVKATDADGDALTYTLAEGKGPAHGTVVVNADGSWAYTPDKDYNNDADHPDSFTVIVSDGKSSVTATVEIGVTPRNDDPVVFDIRNDTFDPVTGHYLVTTSADHAVSGQVQATDVDGDALTYTQGKGPDHGTVVVHADGSWTYTPENGYSNDTDHPDTFTVLVSDGHGGFATATIDIGVNPPNEAPKVFDTDSENFDPVSGHYLVNTDVDTPVLGHVKATDANGDTLVYAKGEAPEHGAVTVNEDGSWAYTPNQAYTGTDTFTVTVSDGHGGTTSTTVEIGINASTSADANIVSGVGEHQASAGVDVFRWTLADSSSQIDPSHTDTITGFDAAARSAGGDVLDLRDLLQTDDAATAANSVASGTSSIDKLLSFLDFDTQSQPGSTVIHVSASGGFQADTTSGQSDSSQCPSQQHIVLANVDIRASMGLDQQANDHQIISELVNRGKLLVDHS